MGIDSLLERADRAAPGFPETNQARAELSRRRIAAERQQSEIQLLIAAIEAAQETYSARLASIQANIIGPFYAKDLHEGLAMDSALAVPKKRNHVSVRTPRSVGMAWRRRRRTKRSIRKLLHPRAACG